MKKRFFTVFFCAQAIFLNSCAGMLSSGIDGSGDYSIVQRTANTSNRYLIKNVTVFTAVPGKPLLENVNVYIADNIIKKISSEPFEVTEAENIDGRGKTLLPGLVDFHTHITSGSFIPWSPALMPTMKFNLESCLYSGITSVVDMGGKSPVEMKGISDEIESGKRLAPHLFYAGIAFSDPNAHPFPFLNYIKSKVLFFVQPFIPELSYPIRTNKDMKYLYDHIALNPDFTKVFMDDIPIGSPKIGLRMLKKIVDYSHKHNKPVIVHIGSNEDVRIAIKSGVDGLAHNVYKEQIDPDLAKELARKKIFVIPTIYVWDTFTHFSKGETNYYTQIELDTIHPSRKNEIMNVPKSFKMETYWDEWTKAVNEKFVFNLYPNLAVLKKAGVTILAGTDTPNLGVSSGGSLHKELEHYVNGGLTPEEALLSATSSAANTLRDVLHKNVNFGTVEEGKNADLLLVEGNPVKNIRDTQNIVAVFFQGKRLKKNHLPD